MKRKSYKIVKMNLAGQRRETVSNGFTNYEAALERACEFESEDESSERRGNQLQMQYVVEEE